MLECSVSALVLGVRAAAVSAFMYLEFSLLLTGFPGGSDSKESACNAGDGSSIPGSGRSPGEGQGHPLQHSCLENSMDRGAWRATVHGVTKSQTQLNDQHFHFTPN